MTTAIHHKLWKALKHPLSMLVILPLMMAIVGPISGEFFQTSMKNRIHDVEVTKSSILNLNFAPMDFKRKERGLNMNINSLNTPDLGIVLEGKPIAHYSWDEWTFKVNGKSIEKSDFNQPITIEYDTRYTIHRVFLGEESIPVAHEIKGSNIKIDPTLINRGESINIHIQGYTEKKIDLKPASYAFRCKNVKEKDIYETGITDEVAAQFVNVSPPFTNLSPIVGAFGILQLIWPIFIIYSTIFVAVTFVSGSYAAKTSFVVRLLDCLLLNACLALTFSVVALKITASISDGWQMSPMAPIHNSAIALFCMAVLSIVLIAILRKRHRVKRAVQKNPAQE